MKAVLSNRIYMECTPEYLDFLNEELTYVIPSYNPKDPPEVIKNMGRINASLVTIPIGRLDLIPEEYEIIDKRTINPVEFPTFKYTLMENQQAVYDKLDDNAMINAWVSWGKTFTSLAIAGKLSQKTLIITHTSALRNQWIREIEKVYGIGAGVIGGGSFELDAPICVGNIQTLYRNIPEIQKEFGTIILDEMHHVSAATFSRVVDTNYARYKIGLSGTLLRKDGKHVVFRDYFGNKIFQPPKENYMIPSIDVIKTDIRFMDGASVPWAHRINDLANNWEYKHLISMLASAYATKGHRVLVVSDRVAFLKEGARLCGDDAVSITGELDEAERERLIQQIWSGEKKILFGTQAIFSEGISVPPLSCLIQATPINNEPLLTQLIGRVLRKCEGKLKPIVVDIHLVGKTATRQASARMGHYIRQGYNIRALS